MQIIVFELMNTIWFLKTLNFHQAKKAVSSSVLLVCVSCSEESSTEKS